MRLFLASILLTALLSGCAAQAQQASKPKTTAAQKKSNAKPTPAPATKAPVAAQPVVVFRRTPCFGTCPHYNASFYADGRMQYEGFAYAPAEGKREVQLPPAVVAKFLQDAEKIGFFQMRDEYPTSFTDMPTTFLTIRQANGTTKTIQAEENFPPSLQKLFDSIDKEVVKAFEITK
ncbi:hypothetical protein HMJ29_01595 [Hymenobacter taeanensis]|uniref:DUF6438 domain-containing protein n=1 Tax=Hymenobacter taeanensis TaxID=2735321 RepID=A0A6M6BCZ4_9BACT|nr:MULTISPECIES: DUF6438 domain-containing protein [Hymenobacter]QJX45698.1 hypothetical protein HMJ29_01595 [Hymenobacter taeanensis]UOQ79536.1 DUF6438 domain-containing protein [Hymenobacter sp. 5414T-23]